MCIWTIDFLWFVLFWFICKYWKFKLVIGFRFMENTALHLVTPPGFSLQIPHVWIQSSETFKAAWHSPGLLLCSRLRRGIKYKPEGMLTAVNNTADELVQYFKLTCWLLVKNFASLVVEVYLSIKNEQHTIKPQHLLDNFLLTLTCIGTLWIVFWDLGFHWRWLLHC